MKIAAAAAAGAAEELEEAKAEAAKWQKEAKERLGRTVGHSRAWGSAFITFENIRKKAQNNT